MKERERRGVKRINKIIIRECKRGQEYKDNGPRWTDKIYRQFMGRMKVRREGILKKINSLSWEGARSQERPMDRMDLGPSCRG